MQEQDKRLLRHSGLGIASFIIAILVLISYLITVTRIILIVAESLNIIGVSLEIAGIVKKNRNKIFSKLGLIFNGILLPLSIQFISIDFIYVLLFFHLKK